jgi:hypothetical protein
MNDLEAAKKRLCDEGLSLSIVKGGDVVYESVLRGIFGFLDVIDEMGAMLEGASIADRVIGKAVALLCVHAKIKAAYAITLSREAEKVFEEHCVEHEWHVLVDNILDRDEVVICPFERLVEGVSNPKEAYEKLVALRGCLK